MPRIVGVDIPDNKSIWISLTYIYGIGKYTSEQILKEARIEKSANSEYRSIARHNLLNSPQEGFARSGPVHSE
jgi:small subunit ribosomal protein S13